MNTVGGIWGVLKVGRQAEKGRAIPGKLIRNLGDTNGGEPRGRVWVTYLGPHYEWWLQGPQ